MKICTVVGARPQFIKAATVSRQIVAMADIEEIIVHTGQHYDNNMSEQFFQELNIPKPKYNLNIGSGLHGKQTGEMLGKIEAVLLAEQPDWVLIYGDTNSTLAGALAAAKQHIPVAHVEAGLRSFNRKMPEEINRITADHLSDILFAPTAFAHQQLLNEGIAEKNIFTVGDVMYDATLFYNEFNASRQTIVDRLGLQAKSFILSTIHRAENTDDSKRLAHICNALLELGAQHKVILPLHPRTKAALEKNQWLSKLSRVLEILEPVGYLDMLALERAAYLIITDSGGVQKEAYFNQVPCITLRDETEWVELVESGWNTICSPAQEFSFSDLLTRYQQTESLSYKHLYGSGNAAEAIVKIMAKSLNSCNQR